jgi:hypothetical protein
MSAENIALGVEFTPIEEGLAPITGHQYGGVFSRRIVASAKLRDTAGDPVPPSTAAHPSATTDSLYPRISKSKTTKSTSPSNPP